MQNEKFYRMLGLAMRAGKLTFGEGAVRDSIRCGKAELIILSDDASANTEKKFRNNSEYYDVPLIMAGDRYKLGGATGKEFAVVVAVCDKGFKDILVENSN